MTEIGLRAIKTLKEKYFSECNDKPTRESNGQDYRYSKKGQAEFKRAYQMRLQRLAELDQ